MAINIEQVDAEELPPSEEPQRRPRQAQVSGPETEYERRVIERTMRRNILRAGRRLAD